MSVEPVPGVTPVGGVPDYIPEHLRGKVWDFKNEPGDAVSFNHPEAYQGLAPDQSRATISKDQYLKTFDQSHRLSDFTDSMEGQYAPLERLGRTSSRNINDSIAKAIRGALGWGTESSGKAIGTAGLLSALGGGTAHYLWDRQRGNRMNPNKMLLTSLLAGLAGAGGTAVGQHRHSTRENYLAKTASVPVAAALIRSLDSDPTLNSYEKSQILSALSRAPNHERDELYRLMRTSIGAGAGVLAMRFLGAKGLMPLLAGGILGGLLSRQTSSPDRNAQGQLSMTSYL